MDHTDKENVVLDYARRFDRHILIESGTWGGAMVTAMLQHFKHIYSIELGMDLYLENKRRFDSCSQVTIVQGDSGRMLSDLLKKIHEPAIFWLDAHYSGPSTVRGDTETPIRMELKTIFDIAGCLAPVVIIDDAHMYSGVNGWPRISEIEVLVGFEYLMEIRDDTICITPKSLR